ncbi:MAG: FAD-dependent monooxygenase [Mycobacterium sp.]
MTSVRVESSAPTPVTIIGGGPVGLSTALFLAYQNIPTVILEQRAVRLDAPRAHVVNPRSLEIYRSFGLDVDRMIVEATSPNDDHTSWFTTRLCGRWLGSLPFETQDDTFTPHPRINLQQPKLERILLGHAAHKSEIDLRAGHRVVGLTMGGDDVILDVETVDHEHYTVRSKFVVAADGAASGVRESLGIGMHGQADVNRCLTVHFEANLRRIIRDKPGMFYWTVGAELPGIFIAYDIDQTWVYISFAAPEQLPDLTHAEAILTDALGSTEIDLAVRHIIPWTMTAQVADRYRCGPVFLVGDAAHRFPPSGGLGLNTGIQDAHNLAWKIRGVVEGFADAAILDTYEQERRPVAEINTQQSLKNAEAAVRVLSLPGDASQATVDAALGGMYDGLNSLGLQLGYTYQPRPGQNPQVAEYRPSGAVGGRLPHAWLQHGGRRMSTLDLLDPLAFTVLAGPDGAPEWSRVDYVFIHLKTLCL